MLGRWLDVSPAELVFATGTHGRPYLPSAPHLSFNVAHSGRVGAIVVQPVGSGPVGGADIGVDVEQRREEVDFVGVMRQVGSPEERRHLEALAPSSRADFFYRVWTRKEAFLKAVGTGMALPAATTDVRALEVVAPDEAVLGAAAGSRWHLCDLDDPAPDYSAALCTRAPLAAPPAWQALDALTEPLESG